MGFPPTMLALERTAVFPEEMAETKLSRSAEDDVGGTFGGTI